MSYEFIKGSDKPFQCKTCGRQFKNEGGFNLHGPCGPGYKKGNNQSKNPNKQTAKSNDPEPNSGECDHEFRLLNLKKEEEKAAYNAGYKEVCNKCLDLR